MPRSYATHLLVHTAATALVALVYAAFGDQVSQTVNRLSARTDVYRTGFDNGYETGYAAGRRIARPVVVPPLPARLGP